MASARSSDERVPAPSSSIAAVRLPTPYLPIGSAALPDRTIKLICASGTSWCSTIQTARPFDSLCFWMAGSFSDGAGPSGGGCLRSGCCAASVTDAATKTSPAKAGRHMRSIFFIACLPG